MPIKRSAKKALRQSIKHRARNLKKKKELKDTLKKFEKAIKAGDAGEALRLLPAVQRALDKSAKSNIIKKNTASRKKSRLSHRLGKLTSK